MNLRRPTWTWGALALAFAVAGLAIVAPLAGMLLASFRVREVVLTTGQALRAAGPVVHDEAGFRFQMPSEDDPDADLQPVILPSTRVAGVHEAWSLAHYRDVFGSSRTIGRLRNSLVLATGSGLLALLLGLPVAVLLARFRLPGRRLVFSLLAAPLLLPPFFAAMGVAGAVSPLLLSLGLPPPGVQLGNAMVCFAGLLFPIPTLLVARALAAVPEGLVEAARLFGGPGVARRHVVWPSLRPAVLASFALVFAVALCDFAVPDLLGVFLPHGAVPVHVFATEIFLQWNKYGNVGRAVATGAPFVLAVLAVLLLAAALLRRCPAGTLGGSTRARAQVRLGARGMPVALLVLAIPFTLGLVLPIGSVMSWGFSAARIPQTVRETVGLMDDSLRWIRLGLLAALLTTAVAVVLARAALRGGRAVRGLVGLVGALPLAVPGMALMVGTLVLWVSIPTPPGSLWKGVLVLVGRFLPYGLLAAGLALREVDPRLEEAGRLLGASPMTRALRIWGPLSRRGIASAFLLVLVFAWRELDALVLIEPGILPVRIYDKVHFGRTGPVADLSIAYLAVLLVPAALVALLSGSRRAANPN